jgi:phenylglyoxylate dehydrogenase epsilon subunit
LPYFVEGKIQERNLFPLQSDFFEGNNIELILGDEVITIEPTGKRIRLKSGRCIEFKKLLIATGANPLKPLKGGGEKSMVLRTIEDAKRILFLAEHSKRASILGAGLIGMKLAEILRGKGLMVTVIESEGYILPNNYDSGCSELMRRIFIDHGIRILTHCRAVAVNTEKQGISIELDNGEKVDSDFLITSVGTRPSIDLVRDSGIAYKEGILVDDQMRTNYPDVYAAGDVAQASDFFGSKKTLNQLLPNAVLQGKVAGLNMVGEELKYDGSLRVNTFHFYSNFAFSMGLIEGDKKETYIKCSPQERVYQKLVFDGSRLVGAVLLNKKVNIGTLVNYLRKRVPYTGNPESIVSDVETLTKWSMGLEKGL